MEGNVDATLRIINTSFLSTTHFREKTLNAILSMTEIFNMMEIVHKRVLSHLSRYQMKMKSTNEIRWPETVVFLLLGSECDN
jgi:hypothetical protein